MRFTHILVGIIAATTIAAALPEGFATAKSLPIDTLKVVAETDSETAMTIAHNRGERGRGRGRGWGGERGRGWGGERGRGWRGERGWHGERGRGRGRGRGPWWTTSVTTDGPSLASLPAPQLDPKE